ncbi:6-phosphogluconolactonase [Corynebacterium halotolerans]|uniref:6-phosphogluconolactonase n=1 Tax=Corynebacterium halotolerans YIM 70093 = DSM 44683 TaxID=1121362 RepID=M1NSV9_9CORY|nr:6-phosphogluconolactonase [Corynebacterium halotolerans]AGF72532.1 6-phosphogluconolactonase [Corynebacterium halotolerans YIM 70093 = DSM 44683]
MATVHRVTDQTELINQAAARFVDVVHGVQSAGGPHGDGVARVVLTGGGAGIGVLRRLAEFHAAADAQSETFPAQRIDWSRVHVFFGDERNVPVSHPESNEGQAREALLEPAGVPETNIHGYGLDETAMDASAKAYEATLAEFAPEGFDIHLLGMGPEGHINTLFPHHEATAETGRLVVPVYDSPKPPPERVTLTLPAVARARHVWLLVTGEGKAEAAGHVAHGADPADWPAAGARGSGETVLFVSEDAAGEI